MALALASFSSRARSPTAPFIGGQTGRLLDALSSGVERLAVVAGFGVERVTVEGQRNATDSAITAALAAGPDTMMLNFDTDAAKQRLEAVPWIRHAQVMRLLPSTLQVVIEEREPYAVWQNKGKTYRGRRPGRGARAGSAASLSGPAARRRRGRRPSMRRRFTRRSSPMASSGRKCSRRSVLATGAGR